MRKTKSKTFSRKSRTLSLLIVMLLIASSVSVGLGAIASAVTIDDDSGGLAMTGAGNDEINVTSHTGNAFWVDATFYDYLSDTEIDSGHKWLSPKQAGTGFGDSEDDWFEFYTLNNEISDKAEETGINYPLYFGNFCNKVNTYSDYVTTSYDKEHNGPYDNAISRSNSKTLYNYEYYINNSNGLDNYNYSITGLAPQTMTNGTLDNRNGMPYFDSAWLRQKNIAKVINSYFPFRSSTNEDTGVTTYTFNSEGAQDNVYFDWSSENGQPVPTSVGYGQGDGYGVLDGLYRFMGSGYQAGYGIFPFNRKEGTQMANRNNNLDYGFGIKMSMDFRVPANGTVDGTVNGSPVSFTYSGDDDLWVYISEYDSNGNLQDGKLVLDLGGNHKKATGNINFATMKATADNSYHASHNIDYDPDVIYIKNNGTVAGQERTDFNNVWVYAWKGGSHTWFQPSTTTVNVGGESKTYLTINRSQIKGYDHFLMTNNKANSDNDWSNISMQTVNSKEVSGYFGNVTYTNNLEWITEELPSYKNDGTVTTNFGFEPKGDGTYKTLDPDKTYRMTIFYMERGMIESNCMMSFTMTPVKNDFKVNKTVDVQNVNAGLQAAVQDMPFTFVTKENSATSLGKTYILNGASYQTNRSGQYDLKHGQTADFVNQHETGSTLSVTETKPQGVEFSTTWNVKDNKTGSVIKLKNNANASGDGLTTGDFALLDPNNASAPANLQANFVNTPEISPSFTLTKKVFENEANIFDNDDGDDVESDDDFKFKILINLYGDAYTADSAGRFAAYNLAYTIRRGQQTINGTATNGEFSVKARDTISFPGMPVGATYCLKEIGCDGYSSVAYSHNGDDTERLGADAQINGVIGDDGDMFIFDNLEGVASAPFAVEKYISKGNARTQYKNGSLFTFRAKGLGSVTYAQGKTSIDATAQTYNGGRNYVEVGNINAQGLAIFQNSGGDDPFLQFKRAGVYIFEVEESAVNSNYANAITKSNQKFLVKYTIEAVGTEIQPAAGTPEYYTYDGGTITPATFSANNKVTTPQFVNEVKTGKITINKKDGKNAGLGGVQFKLYAKDGNNKTEVATLTTNAQGVVSLDNLDVYKQNNGVYTGNPELIEYELTEFQTKSGYFLEHSVKTFSFGINNKFEYTFDYVNAALKHPDTGMFDVFNNLPLGIALMFLAFVSMGLIIAQLKKKQRMAPRFNRFI